MIYAEREIVANVVKKIGKEETTMNTTIQNNFNFGLETSSNWNKLPENNENKKIGISAGLIRGAKGANLIY